MDADAYLAFDRRIAEIAAQPWQNERGKLATRELVRRCRSGVKALPQAHAIPEARAMHWILRTVEAEAGRARGTGSPVTVANLLQAVCWHLRRATGIGGSDAGTLLAESRGEQPAFGNTARNIAAEKLLILPPQPATPAMMRGIRAEPWLQQIYLAQTGAQSEDHALGSLRNARDPDAPWRIGTPDDFVHVLRDPAGGRRMIDYKCPGPEIFSQMCDDGIGIDYSCQLHHYRAIALQAGIEIDTMAIAAFDAENFLVREFPVDHDPDLDRDLERACADFWALVEAGTLPEPRDVPAMLEDTDDARDTLAHITLLRTISREIDTRASALRHELELRYRDQRGKLRIPSASWTIADEWDENELRTLADRAEVDVTAHETVSQKPDPVACVARLRQLHAALETGGDPFPVLDDLRERGMPMSRKLNAAALAAALAEEGVDTAAARGWTSRYLLSTRTADRPVVEAVRAEAAGMADEVEAVAREIKDVPLAEDPAEDSPDDATALQEDLAPAA